MKIAHILELIERIDYNKTCLQDYQELHEKFPDNTDLKGTLSYFESEIRYGKEELTSKLGFSVSDEVMNSSEFISDITEISNASKRINEMEEIWKNDEDPTCDPALQHEMCEEIERLSENIYAKYAGK